MQEIMEKPGHSLYKHSLTSPLVSYATVLFSTRCHNTAYLDETSEG